MWLDENFDGQPNEDLTQNGLNGVVVKSHGGANELGVATAIGNAAKLVRADLTRRIADDLGAIRQAAA